MPDRRKIRWAQLKVGVIGLTASVIVFVLVFLLTSSKGGIFPHNALIVTYMDDASGIANGSVVRLNGFPVGYLEDLQLTGSRDPKRAVRFNMMIQEKYLPQIPVDSVAGIAAANLLGDKFINITRGASTQTVKAGAEVQSLQGQDIPELLAQMSGLLKNFQTMVGRVDAMLAGVEQGRGNLGLFLKDEELYTRLTGIGAEGQRLLKDIRTGTGTFGKLINDDALYQELRAPLKRIDAILADIQSGQGTAGKLLSDPALFNDVQASLTQIKALLADLQSGKGSAGKLLKDEQLHTRINDLVAKVNGIVDKMNAGQGTVGQFLVNQQLYDALNGATREFQSLAKDMRANPKKFLTIRLTLF